MTKRFLRPLSSSIIIEDIYGGNTSEHVKWQMYLASSFCYVKRSVVDEPRSNGQCVDWGLWYGCPPGGHLLKQRGSTPKVAALFTIHLRPLMQ